MSIHPNKKYRPANYADLLAKFRKVEPQVYQVEASSGPLRANVATGLEEYTGEWADKQICHLLKRSLFGIKKSDLAQFRSMTMSDSVDYLLTQGEPPAVPINDYNNAEEGIEDPEIPYGATWIEAAYLNEYEGHRVTSLKAWMVKNMISQDATLEDKMVLFWHNLLVTKAWDVFYAKLSYRYFEMLRRNVFGNFRTLIRELTLDPAMLLFLNGTFNNKEAPDENYGRELQELFCIGKGENANFTEEDVQAAARVLTGWVIDWNNWNAAGNLATLFEPSLHETSDKQFSAFYGNRVITGKTGAAGADELDELLDMIFENNETALYICRRLYNFFVYHQIDEATEANVIVPLAQIFRDSGYEIKPVLEKLFKSAHFHDPANRGAMIKNPPDFLIGLWRTLSMDEGYDKYVQELGQDPADHNQQFKKNVSMLWQMANMGMELADPPSVSGWPAYYQVPSFDKYWITTDTISNRAIMGDSMVYWGFWIREDVQVPADLIAFLDQLDDPGDPTLMLRECSMLFHGIEASDEVIANLKKILLSGQETDGYWYLAWTQLQNDPENQEYRMVVENRLKPTFQHLLQMGETQLM